MICFDTLLCHTHKYPFWREYVKSTLEGNPTPHGIHLAVFVKPYLKLVLNGTKRMESRFSVNLRPPYGVVQSGDVILIKEPGGPVTGLTLVTAVWYYELDESSWRVINKDFKDLLKVQDPKFWESKQSARYATLMRISKAISINPLYTDKRDRRGWVTVLQKSNQLRIGGM